MNQIISDYETVSKTAFWSAFVDRIDKRRKSLSRMCETEKDVSRYQGGIEALDFVLGRNESKPLAERIVLELNKKQTEKENQTNGR